MRFFQRYLSGRALALFAGEWLLIGASIAGAAALYDQLAEPAAIARILVVAVLTQVFLYYNDFYDLTAIHSNRDVVLRLLDASGAALIVIAGVYLVRPSLAPAQELLAASVVLVLLATLVYRLLFNSVLATGGREERVLIVGTDEAARSVAREVLAQHEFNYHILGFIDQDPLRVGESIVNPAIIGTPADIARIVEEQRVNRIVVGLSERRGALPLDQLLRAKLAGARVEDATTMYERITGKILLDGLHPSWMIFSDGFRIPRHTRVLKRGFDVVTSLTASIVALPIMAVTAIAVWMDSGRPILYRQERVGVNGGVFTLYKFRSMRPDAETGTPIWASSHDDRVTRVGSFMRKTRLDELPQLWNVLRGDMSVVGPRPERPFFVEQLAREIPYYDQRHVVKPGVTGWAQVKYRYGESTADAAEKLRYDLYYVKHLSFAFDLSIVFDTVKVIVFCRGAH